MKNKEFKITKVHIDSFIDTLVDLYNKGVDYIDIIATPGEVQDSVGLSFCKEYMSEDMQEEFDDFPVDLIVEKKLSNDDLNQLI